MKAPVTRDLYDYWSHLKGKRAAPDRAEIDPEAIRHILPDTFILEVDFDLGFPIRLCGPRVNAFWLSEQKGRLFLVWWRVEDRARVVQTIRQVVDAEIPMVASACAAAAGDQESKAELELLLLPLRHFGKSHSRMLGSVTSLTPFPWFGDCAAQPLELLAARRADEEIDRPVKDRRGDVITLAAS